MGTRQRAALAMLAVRDNGRGIGPDNIASGSMGMRLIKGVVAQMNGTYEFRAEGGTVFEADIALATGAWKRSS